MIGIQPICDSVLEIWPPALECYAILLPNSLNFPEALLFGAVGGDSMVDGELLSLAMYASSRANECSYCTSHCCSFALRRGVDPMILHNLLKEVSAGKSRTNGEARNDGESNSISNRLSPQESTVIQLAYGLGTVPCTLTVDTVQEVSVLFSSSQIEWLVAAAALFGMFNKLMDGLNIPLETSTYQETKNVMDSNYTLGNAAAGMISTETLETQNTSKPLPSKDDWTNYVVILYQGLRPGGALALDRQLLQGVPATASDCGSYLHGKCGCAFTSVLEWIQHNRFRRGLVAVITRNFVSDNLPLLLKVQMGLTYCQVLENQILGNMLKEVLSFCEEADQTDKELGNEACTLVVDMGKALSYTPSRMTPELVHRLHASEEVTPQMVVELVTFLAVCQVLHRVISFQKVHERA